MAAATTENSVRDGVFPGHEPYRNRGRSGRAARNGERSNSNCNDASEETVAGVFITMRHTELTNDLQERASLYAAGAMTESERREFARHLEEDQCAVCGSEVGELQSVASLIAFTATSATPSPNVRSRLLE